MAKNTARRTAHTNTRAGLLTFGMLALFTVLFFFRALWADCFVAIDFHLTFQPLRSILGDALREGLPLWNDRLGNGAPLFANPMHAACYPPNLLFALFPPARTLTVLTVAHLFFGACGALLLARRLGHSGAGSWVAAVLFAFNGAAVSATSFANLSWSVAWLPWLLLATDRAIDRKSRFTSTLPLGLVVAALLVIGDPFVVVAGAVGAALWSAAALGESVRTNKKNLVRDVVGRIAAGPVLGLLLASPFLLAAFRYYSASTRALGFTPGGMTLWSFPPALGLNLIVPSPFGDPAALGTDRFWATALFPDRGAPLLIGFYIGAVALWLMVLGCTVSTRRRWVLIIWLGLLSLLALGKYGPAYPLIEEWTGLAALRYPMKWTLPAMLPLALLAGRGVDLLATAPKKVSLMRIAWLVMLAILGLLAVFALSATPALDGWLQGLTTIAAGDGGFAATEGRRFDVYRSHFSGAVTRAAIPLVVAAGALFWSSRSRHRSSKIAFVVTAILAADIVLNNRPLAPTVRQDFYQRAPPAVQTILDQHPVGRVYVDRPPDDLESPRPAGSVVEASAWQRDLMRGYTPAAFGIWLAFNIETEDLGPLRMKELQLLVWSAPPREKLMLLGAAGVTHVVSYGALDHPAAVPIADIAGPTSPGLRVNRNQLALPRARVVPTLLPYGGDRGFVRAVETGPDNLFARQALVDRADAEAVGLDLSALPHPERDDAERQPGSAQVEEDSGSSLRIRCKGQGGFLVLSDSFVPGWTAEVDSRPVEIIPVDYAFRAVEIPAGSCEVVFSYRPW